MDLKQLIDHTLLKPTATKAEIINLCREAGKFKFWSVCVNPVWVKLAKQQGVRVTSVIGFPLGANTLAVKVAEAQQAIKDGADELDAVMNLSWLKMGKVEDLKLGLKTFASACQGRVVKIIIETCYLTDKEKVLAAKLVKQSGADFVKTSTGFGSSGATVADVKLLRKVVGPDFGVKASGGIKTKAQALALIKAGANRLGTSSSVAICR
ncbi:MAG: deoxyribose-phosphate aldolase [Patescibacteria group bacterium]|nr:deoxyribose-phosphate aldolase [Patescibacteria group bacterium]